MIKETNNFLDYLRKHIRDGAISYKDYIQLCLYHPRFTDTIQKKKHVWVVQR